MNNLRVSQFAKHLPSETGFKRALMDQNEKALSNWQKRAVSRLWTLEQVSLGDILYKFVGRLILRFRESCIKTRPYLADTLVGI